MKDGGDLGRVTAVAVVWSEWILILWRAHWMSWFIRCGGRKEEGSQNDKILVHNWQDGGSTELIETVVETKGLRGWGIGRMGTWGKTIRSLVWGLLSLRCLVHICSGLVITSKFNGKKTTILLSSGILWVSSLGRAQLDGFSILLCLGPQLGNHLI